MCGINGIINKTSTVLPASIERMNRSIRHRGPNDNGYYCDQNIGLGHTRLSIMDLSSRGHQPMSYDNVTISYNGEVFNFEEIRQDLESKGYTFDSTSDTEVILKAYHCYGIECIERFNGMFALAISDKKKKKLFLIRDRFGIKPLYLYKSSMEIIFSSEIKAILTHDLPLTLNEIAIKQYLTLLYIPHPNTPYNEIEKLPPGYYYEIDTTTLEIVSHQYWELKPEVNPHSFSEQVKLTKDILKDAVQKRMISDVEVGSFLSGGVDSSLITAIASTMTDKKIQTFSIGFSGAGSYFDESAYALQVAKKFGTNHHVLHIDLQNAMDDLDEIIYHLDEPIADTSTLLNFQLAKLTKEHVSVALSGLGGDELFGGYNRHQASIYSSYLDKVPQPLLAVLKQLSGSSSQQRTKGLSNRLRHLNKLLMSVKQSPSQSYHHMISYYDELIHLIPELHMYPKEHLNSILLYDIKYYMNDNLLMFTDKMSMAHALEVRVPFLDYRLVKHAFTMPQKYKTTFFNTKHILKEIALEYLDKEVVYRRKQGFAAPIEIWLQKIGMSNVSSMIDTARLDRFIPRDVIYSNLNAFFNHNKDRSLQIYSYIVLSRWLEINKKYFTE